MSLSGRELVSRLLDATPTPLPGSDVAELLAAFEAILAERAAVLALAEPPLTLSEGDRPLLAELERRQKIWEATLAEALRVVGNQRCGASQLRAYAGGR